MIGRKITRYAVTKEFKRSMSGLQSNLENIYLDHLATQAHAHAKVRKYSSKSKSAQKKEAQGAVSALLNKQRQRIHKLICTDLDYCASIEKKGVQLALEIANVIVTGKIVLLTTMPIPAVKIAVYAVRSRLLDPFCDCNKTMREKEKR